MSNSTNFWLELKLKKEYREMTLEVESSFATKEFDTLVKIIEKANHKDIDLSPLIKFLKDDLLSSLHSDGWKLTDIKFTVKYHELLQYFKDRKERGGTAGTAQQDRWPWVHVAEINTFSLMFDGHLNTTSYVDGAPKGGYVHQSFYGKNQKIGAQNKVDETTSWREYAPKEESSKAAKAVSTPKFDIIKMTKAEGKICRNEIIDIAGLTSICEAGFRPEFIESLNDRHKSYLHECSNLQIKLMRSQITKLAQK